MKDSKSQFFGTKEETSEWLEKYHIINYTINEDLSVNVDGDVYISNKNLKTIPVKFGKVTTDFWCNHNKLISLAGVPKIIGRNFFCGDNNLTDLVGAPKIVDGYLSCAGNKLMSLIELMNCDFKEKIYFNIDEKNFKQKKLIPILKKNYNNVHHHYNLAYNEFHNIIKPQIEKEILQQKIIKNGNNTNTKKIFI